MPKIDYNKSNTQIKGVSEEWQYSNEESIRKYSDKRQGGETLPDLPNVQLPLTGIELSCTLLPTSSTKAWQKL